MKQTYLFGYGSLICQHSRSITCPELSDRISIPVVIQGLERVWNKRSKKCSMTAMGVRFSNKKARCAGLLVPLSEENIKEELALFDAREQGYHRVQVDLQTIERVPFFDDMEDSSTDEPLPPAVYDQDDLEFFTALEEATDSESDSEDDQDEDDASATNEAEEEEEDADMSIKGEDNGSDQDVIEVWVYVPDQPKPPTQDFPIVQSYLDTILRGCLNVGGEDLCKEFLQTTRGWHPEQWSASAYTKKDRISRIWINDRSQPFYPRGDPHYSRKNATKYDALMKRYRADYFPLRVDATALSPTKAKTTELLKKRTSRMATKVLGTGKGQTQ